MSQLRSRAMFSYGSGLARAGANFLLTVSIARHSDLEVFAQFALASFLLAFQQGLVRASWIDGLLGSRPRWAAVLSGVATFGVVSGIVLALVGLTLGNPFLLIAAIGAVGLAVMEVTSTEILLSRGVRAVAVAQSVHVVGAVVGASWVEFLGADPIQGYAVWVLVPSSIGVLYVAARVRAGRPQAPNWIFAADFVAGSGQASAMAVILGGIVGPQGLAGLRGAGTVLAPVSVLVGSTRHVFIRHLGAERAAALRSVYASSVPLVLSCAAMVAVLSALPDGLGVTILGDSWDASRGLIAPLGIAVTLSMVSTPLFAAHKVLGADRRVLQVQLCVGSTRLLGVCVVGLVAGLVPAVWTMAVFAFLELLAWSISLHVHLTEHASHG